MRFSAVFAVLAGLLSPPSLALSSPEAESYVTYSGVQTGGINNNGINNNGISNMPSDTDMPSDMPYTDPSRTSGSQSEPPSLLMTPTTLTVTGYHTYSLDRATRDVHLTASTPKFSIIDELFKDLVKTHSCSSLIDMGCSSGLASWLALAAGFTKVVALDHDKEYIEVAAAIITALDLRNEASARRLKFGDVVGETPVDVVFVGAVIHWIYNLTADFRSFDLIISYLLQSVAPGKFLVIEWIGPHDSGIEFFGHLDRVPKRPEDVPYTTENFESALKRAGDVADRIEVDGQRRALYVLRKPVAS